VKWLPQDAALAGWAGINRFLLPVLEHQCMLNIISDLASCSDHIGFEDFTLRAIVVN